jgi:hypothetical protein
MREARAEKDDSHEERRNQRQSRHRCGTGRARRAGPLEETGHAEEGCAQSQEKRQAREGGQSPTRWREEGATDARSNKKAEVIAMMKRAKGVTLAEIVEATGWQKHTVRGFVSILGSKGGQKIESSKNAAGDRSYRIAK